MPFFSRNGQAGPKIQIEKQGNEREEMKLENTLSYLKD